MSETAIAFVNTSLIPLGLMAIMFSLGLSLALQDFKRLFKRPKAALTGISGQLLLLPLLGWGLAILFNLPPAMAVGLVILSACPGGVTSNAVVFAARGDVALSVTLTALTSMITIFTTPFLISLGLDYFYNEGDAPVLDIFLTIKRLFQMTVLPVSLGMAVRFWHQPLAERLIVFLRPTSLIILISVICFSVLISLDLVLTNLVTAGPVVFLLNVSAMAVGFGLAYFLALKKKEIMTISIEIGVQNATMATFLSLSILQDWNLAITPTIYGMVMIMNAGILVKLLKSRLRPAI